MDKDLASDKVDIECLQCGQVIPLSTWEKNLARQRPDWDLCADCKMTPRNSIRNQHPSLGNLICLPHQGEVNEHWQPLDESGQLYRPGLRICGYKDCIALKHIVVDQSVKAIVQQVSSWTHITVSDAKKILQQVSK
jgi:hypothetical protein